MMSGGVGTNVPFAIPPDQHRNICWRFGDGAAANGHSNIHRKESHDLNPVCGRIFAMMMLLLCPRQQAYNNRNLSDARPTGMLWQATFRRFLHGMPDDPKSVKIGLTYFDTFEVLPLPAAKGGEAFRGL